MNKITKIAGTLLIVALGISFYEINSYRTLYRGTEQKYETLKEDFNELSNNFEEVQKNYANLLQKMESLQNSYDAIQEDYATLYEDYNDLEDQYTSLEDRYVDLQSNYAQKEREYEDLEDKYNMLQESYNALQEKYTELEKKYTFSHKIHPIFISDYLEMVSMYDEEVIDLAHELGDEKSFLGKIIFIFTYVSQEISYELDPPDREVIQSPKKTYQIKKGDCEDQAIFLAFLLKIEGYKVQLNFVDRDHTFADLKTEEFTPNHVTVSVYIPEEYHDELRVYASGKKYYLSGSWLWLEPTSISYIGYTDEIYPFVSFEA